MKCLEKNILIRSDKILEQLHYIFEPLITIHN